MKYCKRCVMPDTRPGLKFNGEGVCQACLNYEKRKNIDWDKRFDNLRRLCKDHKRSFGHDCIIAVSGGKDSHYQVYLVKEVMGMNPLLVSVEDNFPMTEAGKHNIRNISEEFSCDIISLKPNLHDHKKVTRFTFEEYGSPTWYIDRLIYTYPLHMAVKFKIPLIFYGENVSYEYGGVDGEETPCADKQIENGVASEIPLLGQDVELDLLLPPSQSELNEISPVYLSYYVPWNSHDNYLFANSRGFKDLDGEWRRTNHIEDYDQIDSRAYLVHIWMKYPKYGHAYATDYASRYIRYGMLTRDEAIELVEKHDSNLDPLAINDFCKFAGYTYREFWDIVYKFYNKDIFKQNKNGSWELKNKLK